MDVGGSLPRGLARTRLPLLERQARENPKSTERPDAA